MISARVLLVSLLYGSAVLAAPSLLRRTHGSAVKMMSNSSASSGAVAGALYFMTNEPDGNFIVSAQLNTDGSIVCILLRV
ncbi:hypothetical protein NM688_g7826 [Phlebia brevispora]|uniref:Uncharacterized protein n=1 Tax=Phlebia brevispora TaxID=194682 RepID=A0ACC1S0Q6_9APHY|nr:hypothetical protein NM688_g7826 [Phlebia brevispora]